MPGEKFSIGITITAIFLAAIFWIVVTAWDELIDILIYRYLPWERGAWQGALIAALLLTGIAVIILLLMGRNFGEFVSIEVIKEP